MELELNIDCLRQCFDWNPDNWLMPTKPLGLQKHSALWIKKTSSEIGFNLALLLIILIISASAKSSIPAPERQYRLLNTITSLTACMQTKNTATGLYPRRGGFEPRGNANANSSMIKFYLKSQVSTRNNNIASDDICTAIGDDIKYETVAASIRQHEPY